MLRRAGIVLFASIVTMAGCAATRDDADVSSAAVEQAPAATTAFTYEDLVGIIKQKGLTSIEQLLPQLPETFRAHYSLMEASRSLQFASAQNPRVIMYGVDAELTCAFSGDPTKPRFDTLECFQFREADRKFDFREIQFPTKANGLKSVVFSDSNISADGKTDCGTCHGADPRPNWDAYSQWPGAYGESDDSEGSDQYAAFVKRRPTDARYRWLVQGKESYEPYMGGKTFDHAHRPNLKFSDAVNRMNAFRTTRIMTSKVPAARSLGFAIASVQCGLSQDQLDTLTKAGIDPTAALDQAAIFSEVGYPASLWGTNIIGDADSLGPYDHQAGYTYLAMDMGMVMAQDLARAGNTQLQQGLAKITASKSGGDDYTNDAAYFDALNALVPDPDPFGNDFSDNQQAICPALCDAFVAAALANK